MQQYSLEGVIGQGQFGVAHKARHKSDGQLYCIKRIPMHNKSDQEATLKEATLLSTLEHPNIISYKECFIDAEGSLCIVTSFCDEGELFGKIQKKMKDGESFEENEIMDMFIQIASALMYIHSKKILHRDLKTQNIFVSRGPIMVLGDFGISTVLEKTDSFATTVTGTPYYMAPEICSSQPYTFKSDIWSLGCVLYELCTLKHAFAADSLLSLVYQIVQGKYPPIPPDKYSPEMSQLVGAMLVREAENRPSLQQIFAMPYVQSHLQRFAAEERKRVKRTANGVTRRRQQHEETLETARTTKADPALETMTLAEAKAKRRELHTQRRELELKLALINQAASRRDTTERKKRMEASRVPGLGASRGANANDMWDLEESSKSRRGLPGGGVDDTRAAPDAMYGASRGGSVGGGGAASPWAGNMLTPSMATGASGAAQPSAASEDPAMRTTAGGMLYSPPLFFGTGSMGSSMGSGFFGQTAGKSGSGEGVGLPASRAGTPASTPARQQQQQQPGMTSASAPATPASTLTRQQPGLDGTSPAPGARGANVSFSSNATPERSTQSVGGVARHGQPVNDVNTDAYNSEFESDYESDYDDDDMDFDTGASLVSTRMKMLDNVRELGAASLGGTGGTGVAGTGGGPSDSLAHVQHRVGSGVMRSKAVALRERCTAMLGYHFGDVYAFLRRARARSPPTPEAEVQRRLLQLVGNNEELMHGCFLVDQLVFQESMWTGSAPQPGAA